MRRGRKRKIAGFATAQRAPAPSGRPLGPRRPAGTPAGDPVKDSFQTRTTLDVDGKRWRVASLAALAGKGHDLARLPFSLRILLENLLRHEDGATVTAEDIEAVAALGPQGRAVGRDRLPAGARPAAGLHRRAGGGRPGGHARRDAAPGRRSDARSIRCSRSSSSSTTRSRSTTSARPTPWRSNARARVRAQPRALRVPALGPAGVRQLPGRAARHRHRPPGQPRVPGARGHVARRDGAATWPTPTRTRWSAPTRTPR